MRYLGGGIGHQNQDARWTSNGEEGAQNNDMDIDPNQVNMHAENGMIANEEKRLQELRKLALETSNRPAESDDEDVNSTDSDDSEDTSDYSSDGDSDEEVDGYEPYFGPEDGEGDEKEDTGFSEF